jgi:hypothetical protein
MPGIHYTGILVRWDRGESNRFLYAVTDREAAISLGLASSIEKKFLLDRYQVEGNEITIHVSTPLTLAQLEALPLYLYTITPHPTDGWAPRQDKVNHLDGEYRTYALIDDVPREKIDVKKWLKGKSIKIVQS